ncbi:MAG: leucine--tRNA ligase [Bacillota bacterium]|nr:leucine--tRNA ligase [Bacillota bacterium]
MKKYNHQEIEQKWQRIWLDEKTFRADNDYSKPKYYPLIEFPYPSGKGLHVGHPRPYTAIDVVARKRRLEGYNVLFTMGWDAFGLPTENFAIQNKIHPAQVTEQNIERFKRQLQRIGFSFDWDREIDTTDPEYYKWTQWIFLKLFEHGLAYKKEMMINWCPSCKIGLANEEVVGGHCERCGGDVFQRPKSQWMLRITAYADKLLEGLDQVDYIERAKLQQRNWIGRSEGAEIDFATNVGEPIKVFTTRPDTIYGATYMVISPEHPMLEAHRDAIRNFDALMAYREQASKKSEFERAELTKDKTGVEIDGIRAINPATGKEIPVWISDYVLMTYGTGAIMSVPGHDKRDFEFATEFGLPIVRVVDDGTDEPCTDSIEGILINSELINGLHVSEAKQAMIEHLEQRGIAKRKINYKLRDWVFSRQRYWGEPIPLVHCPEHGWVPIPEDQLPLLLPEVDNYEPTDNGESPLSAITDWVETTCPTCGKPAKRETDTMPQWAGSCWYYLRYCDPHNSETLASPEALKYWLPVDWYNGGMEHTTLHLLYSRFWHRFLYDIGVVPVAEPYAKRTSHGMILAGDSGKMSKSRGNVISPDYYTEHTGADAFRLFEMFIGDFEKSIPWNDDGVKGGRRFIEKVWALQEIVSGDKEASDYLPALDGLMHKTIKKVSEDFETLKYNTAIAQMMTLVNEIKREDTVNHAMYRTLLVLLNPVIPHVTEELWEIMGYPGRVSGQSWPSYDPSKIIDDSYEIAVQINGKLRSTITLPNGADQALAEQTAYADPKIAAAVEGKQIVKVIYREKKIFNIVIK